MTNEGINQEEQKTWIFISESHPPRLTARNQYTTSRLYLKGMAIRKFAHSKTVPSLSCKAVYVYVCNKTIRVNFDLSLKFFNATMR